jgi:glutamine synthetase
LRDALPADNETGGNLYGLSSLDEHAALFEALKASFAVQGLPYEGVLKEAAPAQYEINVAYSDDAVAYCDQIIRMQRCIRAVAGAIRFTGELYAKAHGESGWQRHACALQPARHLRPECL